MRERYGDEFEASMGAEAIQELLKEIDLDQLSAELTAEVENVLRPEEGPHPEASGGR